MQLLYKKEMKFKTLQISGETVYVYAQNTMYTIESTSIFQVSWREFLLCCGALKSPTSLKLLGDINKSRIALIHLDWFLM